MSDANSNAGGTKNDANASGQTPGGQPVEDVEDRPNVSTTTPEAYPPDQRAKGK